MSSAALQKPDAFDQVQWIVETIAERNYPVSESSGSWAGRTMLVASVADRFGIPDDQASSLIDQAVARLFDRQSDVPPQVHVRLMIAKIDRHERLLMEMMTKPRERIEYETIPLMEDDGITPKVDENGKRMYEDVPVKRITNNEVPVALHRYMIDLHRLRAWVLSIKSTGDDMKRASQLIDMIMKGQGSEELETTLSVSQKIKRMDDAELDKRRAKRIPSKSADPKLPAPKPASAPVVSENGRPAAAPAPLPDAECRPIGQ